jgi:V8-like Glu-specific endopeptidase
MVVPGSYTTMKKGKEAGQNVTDIPMTIDDFVSLENKADSDEPTELLDLRQHVTQYFSALKTEVRSDPKLSKLSDNKLSKVSDRVWAVELGKDFVLGRIGEKFEALPRPKATKDSKTESKPNLPNWRGINYHPKLSGPRVMRTFRRAKGKRVIPHGYIFGPDDRQIYYPSGYPWSCIGKIFAWTDPSTPHPAWSGAGALVGRNIVLTCSHVCPWNNVGSWMMQFIPAYYDGASLLGSGVFSYVETWRGYRDHGQGDDMSVLKLYTSLGNSLGWFGSKTYHDSWEDGNYWTKCGYPGALASGERPSRITWFPIVDDDSDGSGLELEYHADASPGDSGGPVFGWWDGSPYAIGTHSGGEEEYHFPFSIVRNNVAAGGSALPDLIIWAQNNW